MTNDKQRERLVDLIRSGINKHESTIENYVFPLWEYVADYLLAKGIIVPPCKVGQTVFSQRGCFFLPYEKDINPKEVIPCEVIVIKETKKGEYILLKPLLIETMGMRSSNEWFPFSSIGKTVFLTKEEAEQALKGGINQ